MRKPIAAVLLVLITTSQVFGWNELGHMIVGAVALRRLTPAERDKFAAILAKHPRFEADFTQRIPAELASASDEDRRDWQLQRAGVWPDVVRGFQGADRDRFHRPLWHYINRPHFLNDADRAAMLPGLVINLELKPLTGNLTEMNVVQAIGHARYVLLDKDTAVEDKAVMLTWLFHCVGDLHQPLHSTALFSPKAFAEGDRGGNLIVTRQSGNLHAVWDSLPGTGGYRDARNFAIRMDRDEKMAALGKAAALGLDAAKWLDESHALAKSAVYSADVLAAARAMEAKGDRDVAPLVLPEEYLKAAGPAAEKRLVEAGHRLGAILQEIAAAK